MSVSISMSKSIALSKGTRKQGSGTDGKDSAHAQQTTCGVYGKHVIHDFMATVGGTVVITTGEISSTTDTTGAHLDLLVK